MQNRVIALIAAGVGIYLGVALKAPLVAGLSSLAAFVALSAIALALAAAWDAEH